MLIEQLKFLLNEIYQSTVQKNLGTLGRYGGGGIGSLFERHVRN